jgi:3'-phosphoadenosine 5'-phosphosulfate (PAPS) 3'-phosphatase
MYIARYYPSLRIIGEEDTNITVHHELLDMVDSDIIDFAYITNRIERCGLAYDNLEYDVAQLNMFLDPIDSTAKFIQGNFNPVTILIGITHNNIPLAGVVNFPFYKGGITDPSICYFNVPGQGVWSSDFKTIERVESPISSGYNCLASRKYKHYGVKKSSTL